MNKGKKKSKQTKKKNTSIINDVLSLPTANKSSSRCVKKKSSLPPYNFGRRSPDQKKKKKKKIRCKQKELSSDLEAKKAAKNPSQKFIFVLVLMDNKFFFFCFCFFSFSFSSFSSVTGLLPLLFLQMKSNFQLLLPLLHHHLLLSALVLRVLVIDNQEVDWNRRLVFLWHINRVLRLH